MRVHWDVKGYHIFHISPITDMYMNVYPEPDNTYDTLIDTPWQYMYHPLQTFPWKYMQNGIWDITYKHMQAVRLAMYPPNSAIFFTDYGI